MSVAATCAVWKHSGAKGTARLVLLAIADNADDGGVAWPHHSTIAEKCAISRRAVIDNIDRLKTLGELGVVHRPNRGNVYLVNVGDLPETHRAHHQQRGHKCRFCTLVNVIPGVDNVQIPAGYVQPSASYVQPAAHGTSRTVLNDKELGAQAPNRSNPTTVQHPADCECEGTGLVDDENGATVRCSGKAAA